MDMEGETGSYSLQMKENSSRLKLESVRLATHFLLNSYVHVKKRQKEVMNDIVQNIERIIEGDKSSCEWLIKFLATEPGSLRYLRLYLVQCSYRDIREIFAKLIERALFYFAFHNDGNTQTDDINRIMENMIDLIEKDVEYHCKDSAQYFWVIAKFAQMVRFFYFHIVIMHYHYLITACVYMYNHINMNSYRMFPVANNSFA